MSFYSSYSTETIPNDFSVSSFFYSLFVNSKSSILNYYERVFLNVFSYNAWDKDEDLPNTPVLLAIEANLAS